MMINIKNVEAQAAEQIKKNKTKAKKVIDVYKRQRIC